MGSQLGSFVGLLGLDQQLFTRKLLVACVAIETYFNKKCNSGLMMY